MEKPEERDACRRTARCSAPCRRLNSATMASLYGMTMNAVDQRDVGRAVRPGGPDVLEMAVEGLPSLQPDEARCPRSTSESSWTRDPSS